jgi:phosphopantothenoylcysteine decarboxylase/phosphopantothenate--cysteine ligase
MQALTGRPVATDIWDASISNGMPHIELSRQADLILLAPASADLIAKLAHGVADDLLSSLCLARDCPLAIAPAMNKQMWEHPATQRNIQQLAQDGVILLGPDCGEQACGEHGQGRMLEPQDIVHDLLQWLDLPADLLQGRRILITAGPTQEPIDPVRVISNLSSGKMGYALAAAASLMGAQVTLVSGPTALQAPPVQQLIAVQTAEQMYQAVMQHIAPQEVFISVAAVADYQVAEQSNTKLKKQAGEWTLKLTPTRDILAAVAGLAKPPLCVGFAAESHDLLAQATAKRVRKDVPLLVGNIGPSTFGQDDNALLLVDAKGAKEMPRDTKTHLAQDLVKEIAIRIGKNHSRN